MVDCNLIFSRSTRLISSSFNSRFIKKQSFVPPNYTCSCTFAEEAWLMRSTRDAAFYVQNVAGGINTRNNHAPLSNVTCQKRGLWRNVIIKFLRCGRHKCDVIRRARVSVYQIFPGGVIFHSRRYAGCGRIILETWNTRKAPSPIYIPDVLILITL